MKKLFAAIIVISIIQGCGHTPKTPAEPAQEEKKDTTAKGDSTDTVKSYFPVRDYIRSDIKNAETYYTVFHKYIISGNKTDSSYINPDEFEKLAAEFTTDDLSKDALEKDYNETSFFDQTLGAYTFTYATTNSEPAVKRVDVVASPGEGYDKVRSIYIERWGKNGNVSFVRKMYWKSDHSFQVILVLNTIPAKTETTKVVWNE